MSPLEGRDPEQDGVERILEIMRDHREHVVASAKRILDAVAEPLQSEVITTAVQPA